MDKRNDILLSPGFLAGLLLLLANDFFFKDYFHNALTGKLSDIAGLFIFPLFISAILRSQSKHIFYGVALFFVYWKSPLSDPLLNALSFLSRLNFERVVDYTDLFCLPVLLFSYAYREHENWTLRVSRSLILGLSAFAFMATSVAKPASYMERNLREQGYTVTISRTEHLLRSNDLQSYPDNDPLLTFDAYRDSIFVSLKKDSADQSPVVLEFAYLKNGDVRLAKLFTKGIEPDEYKLIGLLNAELSKRKLAFEKARARQAKVDALMKLVAKYRNDRPDHRAIFLMDTLLSYVTPEFISEHQLYELKADILMAHHNPGYNEEIVALFDRQDSLDMTYKRTQYSVNRYGKRLDFYELMKKDSINKADSQHPESPKR